MNVFILFAYNYTYMHTYTVYIYSIAIYWMTKNALLREYGAILDKVRDLLPLPPQEDAQWWFFLNENDVNILMPILKYFSFWWMMANSYEFAWFHLYVFDTIFLRPSDGFV